MFESLNLTGSITAFGSTTVTELVICTLASIVLGLAVSWVYRFRNLYSHSLAISLVILPAMVQIVIMMVDGNVGLGVAVAGAFSLIRFRSVPGSARDIGHLFFAMSLGFVTGLGFIFYAFLFFVLIGTTSLVLTLVGFGKGEPDIRILHIKIPENLDYEELFDDIFEKHTKSVELESVKTTQMGSLYDLTFKVRMKHNGMPKAFLDELRTRNGNLTIMLSREKISREEL